jgi:hypothetical protein
MNVFCVGYWCYLLISEVLSTRLSTITAYKQAKFKDAILKMKPEVLRSKIDEILGQKHKQAQSDEIATAVAKAKAADEAKAKASAEAGLMGRLFG